MLCPNRHCLSVVRRGWSRVWLAFLLLLGSGFATLQAATPRDELLRFVPPDTAFCLVFQDLRTHWASLRASPFAEQFRQSPLTVAALRSEDWQKFNKTEKAMKEQLGLDWVKLRDDILGESLVLAYRPGPPGKPEQEQGLFLLRSARADSLGELVQRFNASQKQSGALKELQERQHNGNKYFRRVEQKREKLETTYYHLRGPILLMTAQEDMLKRALDQERDQPPDAEPPLTGQLKQMGAAGAMLALWLNPRAFDVAVADRARQAPPAEAQAAGAVADCWKALDGVVLSLHLERDLSLVLALRGKLEQLPEPARRLLTQAGRPSTLGRLFPEDALLALVGRLDLAALLDLLPPKSRQAVQEVLNRTVGVFLGRNFVKDILPNLGPDMGFCLTAPAGQDKAWTPQVLLALRVGPGDPQAPADKALLSAMEMLTRFIAALNPYKIEQKTLAADRLEITFLSGEGVFPPGVQPAFALHSGYLVLASSPAVIRRFGQPQPGNLPADRDAPLLRISFKAWQAYLTTHRVKLVQAMTSKEVSAEEAGKRLDGMIEGLRLFERLELRQQTSKDQVLLTLSLQPNRPLK